MELNPFSRNPLETIYIDEKKTKAVLNDPEVQDQQAWRNVGRALYRCLVEDRDMLVNMLFDAGVYGIDVNDCDGFYYYRSLFNRTRELEDEYETRVADVEPDSVDTIVAPHEVLATNNVLSELKRRERRVNDECPGYPNYSTYDDIVVFANLSPETVKRSCYELCCLINRFSSLFTLQRRICQYYADTGDFYAFHKVNGNAYLEPYTVVNYRCNTPLWDLEAAMFDYVKLLQRCLDDEHKHDLDDEYQRLEDDLKARTNVLCAENEENYKAEESIW